MAGQWLTALWYGGRARAWLLPLACLYRAMLRVRRGAYAAGWRRTHECGAPVVVIGNLTVGGTGKTPLTIWLAQQLAASGMRVGVVSRGYGRTGRGLRRVGAGSHWREVGDEPLLIARHTGCPVMVGSDRVAAERALTAAGAQVIVADDGLQHERLRRVCEIVVIDGARGFGNGALLPAGPLREPPERLARVDAVVINGAPPPAKSGFSALEARDPLGKTRAAGVPAQPCRMAAGENPPDAAGAILPGGLAVPATRVFGMRLVAEAAVPLGEPGARRALDDFRGERVHAVAAIGNPQRFFGELRARGLTVIEHAFPDHHPLRRRDLEFADALPVLMTEKDAVKCTARTAARLWCVPVRAWFDAAASRALMERVWARLGSAGDQMDARLLEILACPVCKGTLKFQREAQVLVCRLDRLAYPIRDQVPVMLEEEARQLAADDPLLER